MTTAALSAGLLWLGARTVGLVLGNLVRVNLGAYRPLYVAKRRTVIPTGCGCGAWMEGGSDRCDL